MTKKKRQYAKKGLSATVTGRELAALLGCDASTVTRLRDQPDFPAPANSKSGRSGRYDLRLVLVWLFQQRRGPASAREQVFQQRADQLAMENAERRGELVKTAQVHEFLEAFMGQVKGALENLPKRCGGVLAGMSDPALVQSYLRKEVHEIRTELATGIERYGRAGDREHRITAPPAKKASKKKAVKKKRAAKKRTAKKKAAERRSKK